MVVALVTLRYIKSKNVEALKLRDTYNIVKEVDKNQGLKCQFVLVENSKRRTKISSCLK